MMIHSNSTSVVSDYSNTLKNGVLKNRQSKFDLNRMDEYQNPEQPMARRVTRKSVYQQMKAEKLGLNLNNMQDEENVNDMMQGY